MNSSVLRSLALSTLAAAVFSGCSGEPASAQQSRVLPAESIATSGFHRPQPPGVPRTAIELLLLVADAHERAGNSWQAVGGHAQATMLRNAASQLRANAYKMQSHGVTMDALTFARGCLQGNQSPQIPPHIVGTPNEAHYLRGWRNGNAMWQDIARQLTQIQQGTRQTFTVVLPTSQRPPQQLFAPPDYDQPGPYDGFNPNPAGGIAMPGNSPRNMPRHPSQQVRELQKDLDGIVGGFGEITDRLTQ